MAGFTKERIAAAVVGVRYPARKWELLAWADYNGADTEMRRALWALPGGVYRSLAEVAEAVVSTSRRGLPDRD